MPRFLDRRSGPANVALIVVVVYGAWILAYFAVGHDVRDFIRIGTSFIARGDGHSHEIRLDPGYRPPDNQNPDARGMGYDGQFSYYIALDPSHARDYIDIPGLRYGRILYPMLARFLALGSRGAIPWTLLLINLLAVGGGTWGLAVWLRRRQFSPYWALVYGLWPGMVIAVQRDLTEPLGYGLVVAGMLALDLRGRWRLRVAGLVFGLAGLARQTALVFPLVLGLWLLLGGELDERSPLPPPRRWRSVGAFLALALGPLIADSVFLYLWLGSLSDGGDLSPVPFAGIVHGPYRASRQGVEFVFVLIPVFIALAALLPRRRALAEKQWLPWLLILANVLLYVVFYGQFYNATYTSISRDAIGIVLAALLCLPNLPALGLGRVRWLAGATALAMVMLPVVAVYGFTNVSA